MSSTLNIDNEWANFLLKSNNNNDEDDDEKNNSDIDAAGGKSSDFDVDTKVNVKPGNKFGSIAPVPTPIYISTKSKIAYLLNPIDLHMFWEIPVMPYSTPSNGVIKKQIKFNSKTAEELNIIQDRLKKELYYDEQVMTHIDNPNGRIKFKDIRKITVGISKKDIMSYRGKKKQAFYNCFVMIIRIKIDEVFREFHIKVFNTGKLEIPGVQSDKMFEMVLQNIIGILQPHVSTLLAYKQKSDTVLINSNFNCGFYINREMLYDILKFKYNIQAIYDPCSYPGIQCKFYYNNDLKHDEQNGMQLSGDNVKNMKDKKEKAKANALANINVIEVSFMIFRTGSVLIVGMCEENVLNDIYAFLTRLLKTEFEHICQSLIEGSMLKDKKKKLRRKVVMIMTTQSQPQAHECVLEETSCNSGNNSGNTSGKIEFHIEDDDDDESSIKKEHKEHKEQAQIVEKRVKRSYNKKKPTL